MTHDLDLLATLAAGFSGALVLGYAAHRLGWSPIAGYLLAGIVIGPYTPGFVANHQLASQLADVGVILLMFGVGLHFHLQDLLAVRRTAITGALCQSLLAMALGAAAARMFGWDLTAALIYGLALSVASTVVLTRLLTDQHQLKSQTGRIAIGWLIVEDLFTVLVLVLLPAVLPLGGHGSGAMLLVETGTAVLKVGLSLRLCCWRVAG